MNFFKHLIITTAAITLAIISQHSAAHMIEQEESAIFVPDMAVLSINETISPEKYDEYLDELRALGAMPLAGLPGNIIIISGDISGLETQPLSISTSIHKRTLTGTWTPSEDTDANWHRTFNNINTDNMLISQEDAERIQEALVNTRDRSLSFRVAAQVIDKTFDRLYEEGQEKEQQEPDNLPHQSSYTIIDGLNQDLKQLQLILEETEDPTHIEREINWIAEKIEALKSHSAGIQGPKSALNRITLAVFFPESNNTGNENWSAQEVDHEIAEIISGTNAFVSVAPEYTNLFFDFVIHGFNNSSNTITHEPSSGVDEVHWIRQLLANVNIPGNLFGHHVRNQQYEETVAQSTGASHATTIYYVRDENTPIADFNNPTSTGWPHAYSNGYFVMNSASKFGSGVTIHELLHTVNAADQYSGSNGINPCKNRSIVGHDRTVWAGAPYNQTNANHADCIHHITRHRSIMRSANLTDQGNTQLRPAIDWYSRAAIGWNNTGQAVARTELLINGGTFAPPASASIGNSTRTRSNGITGIFRYMPTNQTYAARYRQCLIHATVPDDIRFPQGVSITPYARCEQIINQTQPGISGGQQEIDQTSPANFFWHEGFVQEHVQVYEPAAPINISCHAWPYWHDGFTQAPIKTPMGCYVRDIPQGLVPFVWSNSYYVLYHHTCVQGTYQDGNCLLSQQSQGGYYVISSNQQDAFWIDLLSTTSCSQGTFINQIPGFAAICLVAQATPGTHLFVKQGSVYSTPTPGCIFGTDDSRNCYLGAPPAGTTAKHDSGRYYYVP